MLRAARREAMSALTSGWSGWPVVEAGS